MNDNWNQLESLAARWSALTTVERDDARQLARALRPSISDLPRLVELAEKLLPGKFSELRAASAEPADAEATSALAGQEAEHAARAVLDGLLLSWAGKLSPAQQEVRALSDELLPRLAEIYGRLGSGSRGRYVVLQLLATDGRAPALAAFAERMVEDPPADARQTGLAFFPLFQGHDYAATALFPRLLDALARPQTATLALDAANYAVRQGLLTSHPARRRTAELGTLLGGVVQRLLQMEEHPDRFEGTPADARQAVADWVALSITLCQALALCGDDSVAGKLEQVLSIGHRRLRAEAAAALAQLGQKRGVEVLVAAAAEPATRTRALDCLETLGELERVPAEQRTPTARVIGEMAQWLASPAQFGVPPLGLEVLDQCRQFWPGYDEPLDCYLVGFEYQFPQGEYSNVGIVGPVTNALTADLEDLVPADVYAVFAGWQAEHPEIQEQAAASLDPIARQAANERLQSLAGQGFAELELVKAGLFFGDPQLVATAVRQGQSGTIILDGNKVEWYPRGDSRRAIGPQEAYWMHKGRKLLAAFNPPAAEE